MEVAFAVEDLTTMKRTELQKLCKSVGIKANSKTARLIKELEHFMNTKKKSDEIPTKRASVVEEVSSPPKHKSEEMEIDSYKQEILQQLKDKVKETMPKSCKIPRFVAQGITVPPTTTPGSGKSSKNWKKIHQAQFAKMDSIDVYLAKKRKRQEDMENGTKSAQGRKILSTPRKSFGKSDTTTKNPSVPALPKSATFVFGDQSSDTARGVKKPSKDHIKSRLKSPKVFKPLTVSFNLVESGERKPKTPSIPRKSLGATPQRNRYSLGAITNIPATTPTPRKKFDLQASLAKPLSYKPYSGKLQPVSKSGKEPSKIPVKKTRVVSHKVDVKAVKVSTRDQRRDKATRNRVNKRSEAMDRRRGIVH